MSSSSMQARDFPHMFAHLSLLRVGSVIAEFASDCCMIHDEGKQFMFKNYNSTEWACLSCGQTPGSCHALMNADCKLMWACLGPTTYTISIMPGPTNYVRHRSSPWSDIEALHFRYLSMVRHRHRYLYVRDFSSRTPLK